MKNEDEKMNKETQCNLNIYSKKKSINYDKSVYFSRILFYYKYNLIKKKNNGQINSNSIQENIIRLNNFNINNGNKVELKLYYPSIKNNKKENNTIFQKLLSISKKKNNSKSKILNSQIIDSRKDINIYNNMMKQSKFPLINLSNNSYIINEYSSKTYINLYKQNKNHIIFNPFSKLDNKKNNKKKNNIFPKVIKSKSTIIIKKKKKFFKNERN